MSFNWEKSVSDGNGKEKCIYLLKESRQIKKPENIKKYYLN